MEVYKKVILNCILFYLLLSGKIILYNINIININYILENYYVNYF